MSGAGVLSGMFFGAPLFNGDVTGWNVRNAYELRGIFQATEIFNQDISGWDVSGGIDFGNLFLDAKGFNQVRIVYSLPSLITYLIFY